MLSERSGIGSEPFHVVTNGRDERLFAPGSDAERLQTRQRLGIPASAPLLVYAGSAGPQYRFDLMARYFQAIRAAMPGTRMLMLSGTPDRAREELTRHSSSVADFTSFVRPDADQVPLYLAAADAGFAFRSMSFSTRAVAPVKLGEYLLCGLPVIGTGKVGDSATAGAAGLFLDESSGPDAAAEWLRDKVIANREAIRGAARQAGLDHFSLGRSVDDYTRAVQAAQV